MKKSRALNEITKKIQEFAPGLGGVFTYSDLWNLLGLHSSDRTAKAVARLVREGFIQKIRRGIYAVSDADLWTLGSRIQPNAYVSMDSVLAKNGLVGTVPRYSVSMIYPGPPKKLKTPLGLIRYFKIKKELMFGFVNGPRGIPIADSEKAYLDLLYYYAKGARFVIDAKQDVQTWKLDQVKLKKYLKSYNNPKFVKFVEGCVREKP